MAITSEGSGIEIWNTKMKKKVITLKNNYGTSFKSKFMGNYFIISGDSSGDINIWNLNTKNIIQSFKGYLYPVWKVLFSFDGTFFFTHCWGSPLNVWKLDFGTKKKTMDNADGFYCMSLNGTPAVISVGRNELIIRNMNSLEFIKRIKNTKLPSVTCSPDGRKYEKVNFSTVRKYPKFLSSYRNNC